jgi:hypothetical protein
MFIFIGKSIRTQNDALIKMSVEELFKKIKQPKIEFQDRIKQLRMANTIDVNRYKLLKRDLPYFTCGNFHPNFRRKENFTSIEYFVIDLDHLTENEIDIDTLKQKLSLDTDIVGFFVSPSADGLKVMFKLEESCKDSGLFSGFYKLFIQYFSQKYNLQKVIDTSTSDVTRACFISWDPELYYNSEAATIRINNYFTVDDFEVAMEELKEAEKIIYAIEQEKIVENKKEIPVDILHQIKQKLSPNIKKESVKNIYLPPEIDELIPLLKEKLEAYEIQLIAILPINYGRKIRVKAGIHQAELNLFYGKKGYTLVKTPKSGTNPELASLTFTIIDPIIHPYYYGKT